MKKTVAFIRAGNLYNDSRATKEIQVLVDMGFQVVALGWNREGQGAEKMTALFPDGCVISRFYNVSMPSGIGMRNIDKLADWLRWTRREIGRIPNLSAVHACNLDGALGVERFCRRRGIPLIYDIFDYYVDSHSIPGPLSGMIRRMEDGIITRSAATLICTEERREQIQKARPGRVEVIHNSPDVKDVPEREQIYDYAYCGTLGEMRLVRESIEGYRDHPELRFAFAGNYTYQTLAEEMANQFPGFTFFGTVPYSRVLEIESQTRVLSAIYEPTIRNHRLCAPNKFYEALALGKPLIVCRGTGIDRVVEQYQLGKVIEYDQKAFFDALLSLLSDPEECAAMGRRGRELYEQSYRWEIMADKLKALYRSILGQG